MSEYSVVCCLPVCKVPQSIDVPGLLQVLLVSLLVLGHMPAVRADHQPLYPTVAPHRLLLHLHLEEALAVCSCWHVLVTTETTEHTARRSCPENAAASLIGGGGSVSLHWDSPHFSRVTYLPSREEVSFLSPLAGDDINSAHEMKPHGPRFDLATYIIPRCLSRLLNTEVEKRVICIGSNFRLSSFLFLSSVPFFFQIFSDFI